MARYKQGDIVRLVALDLEWYSEDPESPDWQTEVTEAAIGRYGRVLDVWRHEGRWGVNVEGLFSPDQEGMDGWNHWGLYYTDVVKATPEEFACQQMIDLLET
jgi:hypothetical protein